MTGDGEELSPSQVRERILAEHDRLRRMLVDVDSLAATMASGNRGVLRLLKRRARELYEALSAHIDLEDRILAPTLREAPGFGQVREEMLLSHHADQRETLREALEELERPDLDVRELGRHIQALVEDCRVDMLHEDRDLLNANLLKDDPIDVSFTG